MEAEKVILQFSCPDKPGVLAAVTQFLFKNDAFMTEVSSFSAHDTKRFFNRIAFQKSDSSSFNLDTLEKDFLADLNDFNIDCSFYNAEVPCRTVIAVSKYSHCLNDIIHRWEVDALPIDIRAIISNHDDARSFSEWNKIPYHHLPVSAETKKDQEKLFGIKKLNVPRSSLPAITHVDYSARVQTVCERTNPRYAKLIKAFKAKTGCPTIVNTSFNVRGEPIVCSPEDAYRCFMRTEMDVLVLQNQILFKNEQPLFKKDENWKKEFELD